MAQSLNTDIFKSHFLTLAVSLAALTPSMNWAQSTAGTSALTTSGSINATATVVQPLTISSTNTLNFGSFVAGNITGTVTISPNPYTRTSNNGVRLVASNPGLVSTVVVTGVENTGFTVNFPQAPVTLSTSAGGASMTLNNFTSSLGTTHVGMIPAGGSQTFQVGATLIVGANQISGVYSGSVPITVNYP